MKLSKITLIGLLAAALAVPVLAQPGTGMGGSMQDMPMGIFPFGPIMGLVFAFMIVIPFWRIFPKAGYSRWLSLLMVVPVVNLIVLYFLAFSSWPSIRNHN